MTDTPTPTEVRPQNGSFGSATAADEGLSAAERALFLPRPSESVAAYAVRLRATHAHLSRLLIAVERGLERRPLTGWAPEDTPTRPLAPAPPMSSPVAVAFTERRGVPAVAAPSGSIAPGVGLGLSSSTVGATISPIVREPVVAPAPDPPAPPDRREPRIDRRVGAPDRRRGRPDPRADKVDRRIGATDRRLGHDRRARSVTKTHSRALTRVDPVKTFWVMQVVVWTALVAIALLTSH